MENQEDNVQEGQLERVSMKMIWRSIMEALNLERGILYTIYALAVRPGEAIREYLYKDRSRLVHPLRFLIIFVTLATIGTLSFVSQEDFIATFEQGANMNGGMPNMESMDPEARAFMELYINNISVANLKFFNIYLMLSVPLAALATVIIYRYKQYNFAEHLVINGFIYSNTTVLYIFFIPLFFIIPYSTVSFWYMIAAFPYYCFCCYQVFKPKGWGAIGRSLVVFLLQGIFAMMLAFIFSIGLGAITALYGIELTLN